MAKKKSVINKVTLIVTIVAGAATALLGAFGLAEVVDLVGRVEQAAMIVLGGITAVFGVWHGMSEYDSR